MPRIERTAEVTWEGSTARGAGRMTAGAGAFADVPFSLPSRIAPVEGRTSPEELLAAAHAGCLTMSLATELGQAGTPPTRLDATCVVVMDEVEGQGHQIVASRMRLRAEVDGAGEDDLAAALERADAGCPFSTLLRNAGVEVDVGYH